jgi:hypothetical protein
MRSTSRLCILEALDEKQLRFYALQCIGGVPCFSRWSGLAGFRAENAGAQLSSLAMLRASLHPKQCPPILRRMQDTNN